MREIFNIGNWKYSDESLLKEQREKDYDSSEVQSMAYTGGELFTLKSKTNLIGVMNYELFHDP